MVWQLVGSADSRVETAKEKDANFEYLFRSEWSRLVRILHRLTGDRAQAEDIVQEAFLRLHQRQGSLQNPAAWLYRVAIHQGLDALRTCRRRSRREQASDVSKTSPLTPDTRIQLAEQQELVSRVLSLISKRSAQLLVLRYSGVPFVEIAEVIGVRVSYVGTLLNRAEVEFKKRYLKMSKGARP